jgi:ferredoxin
MHALAVGMLSEAEIDGNLNLFRNRKADPKVWDELEKRERKIQIMEQFCKGCGNCVPACASKALYLEHGKAKIKREDCILCGYCAAACPEFMIRVV